jgi:hypothetical protein
MNVAKKRQKVASQPPPTSDAKGHDLSQERAVRSNTTDKKET